MEQIFNKRNLISRRLEFLSILFSYFITPLGMIIFIIGVMMFLFTPFFLTYLFHMTKEEATNAALLFLLFLVAILIYAISSPSFKISKKDTKENEIIKKYFENRDIFDVAQITISLHGKTFEKIEKELEEWKKENENKIVNKKFELLNKFMEDIKTLEKRKKM